MTAIGESAKIEKERYKKFVEENEKYLNKLTNAILYLDKQELPLRDAGMIVSIREIIVSY